MVKQLENGYKDTALEIAGKCIIKSGYCMLLILFYISVLLQFKPPSHIYIYMITLPIFGVFIVDFINFQSNMSNDCKLQ